MKHQVDVPPDRQPFIDPPFLLLVLGVPGVLLGKQGLDLRRQRLGEVDAILQEPQLSHPLSEDLSGDHISTPGLFCCYLFSAVWCTFSFRARQYTAAHPTVFYMPFPLAAGYFISYSFKEVPFSSI